jgi:hypothetical protein
VHALLLGRRLALIGIAISVAAIIATLSGIGKTTDGLGELILAAGGITAGLVTTALLLLATPPPRTPLGVHVAAGTLVAGGVIAGILGGIVWAAGIDESAIAVQRVTVSTAPLLYLGIVLAAAGIGLLVAQLVPPAQRGLYLATAIGPVAVVLLLAAIPASSEFVGQLAFAASNLALGAVFIAPIGATAAYAVTTDKIRKVQKRAAA